MKNGLTQDKTPYNSENKYFALSARALVNLNRQRKRVKTEKGKQLERQQIKVGHYNILFFSFLQVYKYCKENNMFLIFILMRKELFLWRNLFKPKNKFWLDTKFHRRFANMDLSECLLSII